MAVQYVRSVDDLRVSIDLLCDGRLAVDVEDGIEAGHSFPGGEVAEVNDTRLA